MRCGVSGIVRFRSVSNRPSAANLRFRASKARRNAPAPDSSIYLIINWNSAAFRVETDPGLDQNLQAVAEFEVEQPIVHPEHGTANLAIGVFERKVDMPRAGPGQIGDFTCYPDGTEIRLEQVACFQVYAGSRRPSRFSRMFAFHRPCAEALDEIPHDTVRSSRSTPQTGPRRTSNILLARGDSRRYSRDRSSFPRRRESSRQIGA